MGWKLKVEVTGFSGTRVEREPMWDGNPERGSSLLSRQPVEREPMWDGNTSNPLLDIESNRVEREPMWDGNRMPAG